MREPVLTAFLLVDSILTQDNHKKILIGLFNQFSFSKFPAQAPPWFIFAAMENLDGHNTFTCNLTAQETHMVIFSIGGEIEVNAPLGAVELAVPVPPIIFQIPGAHLLELVINGNGVASRTVQVAAVGTEAS